MRVLGIDTSGDMGSLGLIDGAHTLYEGEMPVRPGGAERLPAFIQKALNNVGWDPGFLELIVVGKGPGSYTGVRVGIAIAKGLAFSLKIPLVGVNTLYALAANTRGRPGFICPVLESRRGEVYAALYFRKDSALKEVNPPGAWEIQELCRNLMEKDTSLFFLGDGARLYKDIIRNSLGARAIFGDERENRVNGAVLAQSGLAYWEKSGTDEKYTLLPLYLKRTEAEIRWDEGRGRSYGCHRTDAP